MSDYLQTLVGLARGNEARVRPVTRSHYETPLAEPAPPTTNFGEETAQRSPPVAPPAENFPAPIKRTVPPLAALAPLAGKPPGADQSHPLSAQPGNEANILLFPSHAQPLDSAELGKDAKPISASPTPAAAHLPAPRGSVAPPRASSFSPLREPRPKANPEALAPEISSPGFRPQLVERPKFISSLPNSRPVESAPRPPDIHVTIGRIDVRAAPAQERPAPRAKSSGPALSLDDYLKTRDGRRA